jgi:site-specific DNA-methyltransferase (adenine-specific)
MSREILIHPAAEAVQPLEGPAFEALVETIRRFGDRPEIDPIVAVRVPEADGSLNGKIALLSGRDKLAACKKLGIEANITIYEGTESAADLAASIQILRRHLSTSQRAAAGVLLEQQFAAEARIRQKAAGGDRKSLLAKLPKAIGDKILPRDRAGFEVVLPSFKGDALNQLYSIVTHKSWLEAPHTEEQTRAEIFQTIFPTHKVDGLTRDQYRFKRLSNLTFTQLKKAYADATGNSGDELVAGNTRDPGRVLTEATLDKLFEPPLAESDVVHSRDRAAQICDVSSRTIGDAKLVFATDRALFDQIRLGAVTLAQATSEVRRRVKRKAIADIGPLERPRDRNGLTGIRDGDCNKILPVLPRRKFRLIFADPPYNIGIDYGDGSKSDRLPDAEYLAIHERWIREVPELLTPDGSVWVVISDEYAAEFVVMLKRAGLKMRNWIKWYETFGTNCANKFNRTSRHILYFVRDLTDVVFDQDVFAQESKRQQIGDPRANPWGKRWDDVWHIPRLPGNSTERLDKFPTQLPLALVRPIVEGCTDQGDLVLDPFSGSGTTAVACKMAGRECLGIEKSPVYAAASRARLAATTKHMAIGVK